MKNLLPFLLLCLFSINCFAQEVKKLPEIPWANLVEMHSKPKTHNGQWGMDVKVKLVGCYNQNDSLIIAEAIQQLNAITESISISFSDSERGNLEVFFIDTTNTNSPGYYLSYYQDSEKRKEPHSNKYFISNVGRTYSRIFIEKEKLSPIHYRQALKNQLAKEIGGGSLTDGYFLNSEGNAITIEGLKIAKNRNSIFNRYDNVEEHRRELNELDISIIRETYKAGYKEKLEIANQQFKFDPWWMKVNPSAMLLLPFGILFLVFAFAAIPVFKWISNIIKNSFLSFNLKVLIALTLIISLLATYSYFHVYWYHFAQGEFHLSIFHSVKTFGIMFFNAAIFFVPLINLIAFLEKLIQKQIQKRNIQFVLIFMITFILPVLLLFVLNLVSLKRFAEFSESDAIKQISIACIIFLILAGFRVLISYFFNKERDLVLENETKLSYLHELKSKAELNALHSKINPHFLYNSLNSIAGLAHDNANKAEHMALSLSKLFRYSINKEKSDWTTFKNELEMVSIYLDVEKVRFDDRLTYSVEIPDELKMQKIPRFIIQPLVENAVKHGISKSVDGGEIKVNITKEGKSTTISVSDSGQSFPDDLTPGFGIQSIYDKLEILYKNKFEMNFTNSPQKQVTLKLK